MRTVTLTLRYPNRVAHDGTLARVGIIRVSIHGTVWLESVLYAADAVRRLGMQRKCVTIWHVETWLGNVETR